MSDIGRDPVFAERLAGEGLTLPIYPENGRFPTYLEVLALVTGIDGYTVPDASEVDAEHDYSIIVEDAARSTGILLEVHGSVVEDDGAKRRFWERKPGSPREFCFDKGDHDMICVIARRLSQVCGPLLLCNDLGYCTGVEAGSDCAEWTLIGQQGANRSPNG